jgi:hypothetical protein
MIDARPRFPLYIPSKGRHAKRLTSDALTAMGVPHFLVVEPQEVDAYQRATRGTLATVLPLDMAYKSRYELCDDLGLTKSTGPGPARNFIWDHSIAAGHAWHWVMDDNIQRFDRLHHNSKIPCRSPAFWRAMEDFVLRYENVAMAGPNYAMFKPCREQSAPFITNTRIYSCNLIRNDLPFRWRGRYNEDTILSLDQLKAGWCTVQFNAFLQWKVWTQTIGGGNTAEFYAKEGTAPKSEMLKAVHPDVTKLVWKFGRHHHHCDYKRFKQPLLRKPDAVMQSPTANAMRLVKVA